MQPCPRQRYEAVLPSQREHASHWRDDGTCSYCGSISPAMLFEQIEKGAKITPTDKPYKVYVDLVEANVRGAGKFYFQHLDDDEQTKFVELYNARKITMGFPGHFYVLPFFCSRTPKSGD